MMTTSKTPTNPIDNQALGQQLEDVIENGAQQYFEQCESRIPGFIAQHFTYSGALAINRRALGWDIVRAPVNLCWAPIYALVCIIKFMLQKLPSGGWLSKYLERIPAGYTTEIQRHISQLIVNELLAPQELKDCIANALHEYYIQHSNQPLSDERFYRLIDPLIADALAQYQITRTASADITNSVSCTVLGAFLFQKFTPGGIGIAIVIAFMTAKTFAANTFILGPTLGNIYYTIFPPEPSLGMTVAITVAIMGVLSAIAAFSGILTDPIQAAIGLHQRRLKKMISHLQQDFVQKTHGSFRPKDQFIARLLDMLDMVKSSIT